MYCQYQLKVLGYFQADQLPLPRLQRCGPCSGRSSDTTTVEVGQFSPSPSLPLTLPSLFVDLKPTTPTSGWARHRSTMALWPKAGSSVEVAGSSGGETLSSIAVRDDDNCALSQTGSGGGRYIQRLEGGWAHRGQNTYIVFAMKSQPTILMEYGSVS